MNFNKPSDRFNIINLVVLIASERRITFENCDYIGFECKNNLKQSKAGHV